MEYIVLKNLDTGSEIAALESKWYIEAQWIIKKDDKTMEEKLFKLKIIYWFIDISTFYGPKEQK